MRSVSGWVATAALVALVGCGGSDSETRVGTAEESAAKGALEEFFDAASRSDGDRACALLTDRAKEEIAEANEGGTCAELFPGPPRSQPLPSLTVEPVGVEDDVGVAVVRLPAGPRSVQENLVYLLRREGDTWRIESLMPIPSPEDLEDEARDSEEATKTAEEYLDALSARDGDRACALLTPDGRSSLRGPPPEFPGSTYGPDRIPIEEFTPCEWHAELSTPEDYGSYEKVLVIGDVALAYPPGEQPTLLVETDDGWRVDPVSLGEVH